MIISETWKGAGARRLVVSEPGGTVDGKSLAISGTPRLRAGEDVVLFLYRTPIGYWRTVGMGQGCYVVENGRIRRNLFGIALADGLSPGTPLESLEGLGEREFRQRIMSVITGQPAGAAH